VCGCISEEFRGQASVTSIATSLMTTRHGSALIDAVVKLNSEF
jgi:hypothetical protein